jgi:hypothetical protein
VEQIELNRQQAEALVARLAASLDAHRENPTEIQGEGELPPEYPARSRGVAPELAAQGVEILDIPTEGRQNRGHRRPVPIRNPGQGTNLRPTPANERLRRNPLSPSSQGYELNRGVNYVSCNIVTDPQGPPSERTREQKLWDFKTRAQQYARDRESCDDTRISYLEFLETEAEDDLALARMIAG